LKKRTEQDQAGVDGDALLAGGGIWIMLFLMA
jgi:hypothetical protein